FAVQAVPEPGASAVLCLGLASFASRFRRRQGS
ncbi:MAG: PEP-CTERM sorting domain-containing protein, partial [Planctomycetota bacterium]